MRAYQLVAIAASALAFSSSGVYGQSVISAHSGVLHYSEGDVTIEGQAPHQKAGTFAEVKEKQELQTQVGRAEVLLTPGVIMRLGENSGIRMVSNKLADTQIAFLKGSAILDFVDIEKDNAVRVNYQDYDVTFLRKGIYRFDSEPAEFKVYAGEAVVTHGGASVHIKDGRALPFTPALVSEKFDNRTGDSLYRWAKRRSEYIAVANVSAAKQMGSGYASTGTGLWSYNPYYSMFTFIPGNGIMCNPFAMYACYYSPGSAWRYFPTTNYYYGNGGSGNQNASGSSYRSAGYHSTSIGTAAASSPSYAGPSMSAGAVSNSGGGATGGFGTIGSGAAHSGGAPGGHSR